MVIAEELINVAMQFVAARFADGGDDSARVAPILRAVGGGQHAKLPQHLDPEQVARGAARCVVGLIVDIGPVQKKTVGVHAAAAHAHLGAFPLIGIVTAAWTPTVFFWTGPISTINPTTHRAEEN